MKAVLVKVGKAFGKAILQNIAIGPVSIWAINHWQLAGALAATIQWVGDNVPTYLTLWAAEARSCFRWKAESRFAGAA
jgi:hypothetical protein